MQRPEHNPWLIHLIWKFLNNDKTALSLIANNPFPNVPPNYIKVEFYKYEFTNPTDKSKAIWERTYIGTWFPPLSRDSLREFIEANSWN